MKTAQAAHTAGCRLRRTATTSTSCLRRARNQRALRGTRRAPGKLGPRRQMGHVHRMATVPGRRTCRHKVVARRCRQTRTVRAGTLRHLPGTARALVRTLRNPTLSTLVDVELVLHHWHHESHFFVVFSTAEINNRKNRYRSDFVVHYAAVCVYNAQSRFTPNTQQTEKSISHAAVSLSTRSHDFLTPSCLFVCGCLCTFQPLAIFFTA